MPGATDNYKGNLGTNGEDYASDAIASVHWPRVKMTWGVDGVAVDASASNPVPVGGVDTTATGAIAAAAQSVAIALNGKGGVAAQITGTWVGTLQFEGTIDGTTWVTVNGVVAGTSTPGPTTTANGIVRLTPSGLAQVRVIASAWTSGTATVTLRASDGTGGTFLNQSLTAGANRIGQVQLTGSTTATALGLASSMTAYGNLRVTTEPTVLFNDPYDGTVIDVTDRWNAAAVVGTATVTQGSGGQVLTMPVTAAASAFIDSRPTFAPLGLAFLAYGEAVKLEAQTASFFVTNQHRFWGLADRPAAFALAAPLKNAFGFEIDATGQLLCCAYSNGTRVFTASTSLTGVNLNTLVTPSAGYCRFGVAQRADTIVFYIGTTEFPAQSFSVSSAAFTLPDIQALPIRHHTVNHATLAASAITTTTFTNTAIGDTSGSNLTISDGVHGFRKATVSAAGALLVNDAASGFASTANSSTANLAAAAVFTGSAEDLSGYSTVMVTVFSSHASATDGLQLQQSHDGINWDFADAYTIPAATGKVFSVGVQAKFFHVVYTNGATLTTTFRLQTIVSKYAKKYSSVRPQDGRGNDNDFEEKLAYLMGFNGTSWDRLRSTTANGLAVDVTRLPTSTLAVTATGAVNTAVTATLPAAGAGLFHYITSIQIMKLYNVIGVAAGAGVIITSTNLPGTLAWTTEQLASAAGTVARVVEFTPDVPLKVSVANTATTIVAPLQLQTIWRINVTYYTGP